MAIRATYAIGDIQGCCDEFEALLAQLHFDRARDRLWLTGDLVNRGPRSLDVLRLVKSLGSAAITVLGNHDLHLLAAALTPGEQLKPQDTLGEIFEAPDRDELLTWLRSLPLLHHDATLGYTMIHAGLPPQWDLATARSCAPSWNRRCATTRAASSCSRTCTATNRSAGRPICAASSDCASSRTA
jgi:bis(5'-nucleosyl)-tetraphosphatase (symmetrical)